MTTVLLSVRPEFARALLGGTKTAEVRKRFPDQPLGTKIIIYASSPEKVVLGCLRLDAVERPAASDVWRIYRDRIGIDRVRLDSYLAGSTGVAILRTSSPEWWDRPVPLSELRSEIGVNPPQSYRYLDEVSAHRLARLGSMSPGARRGDLIAVS